MRYKCRAVTVLYCSVIRGGEGEIPPGFGEMRVLTNVTARIEISLE